jgi:hypothetical protein
VLLAAGAITAARVTAAPTCVDFDGGPTGTGTAWGTGTNWSTDAVPGLNDAACIGSTFTVVHSTGTDSVAAIQSSGILQLTGGTIDVTSPTDPSAIARLTMSSGTLSGARWRWRGRSTRRAT